MTAQEISPFAPNVTPEDVLAIVPGLSEPDIQRMQTLAEVGLYCIADARGFVGEALHNALSDPNIKYSDPVGERMFPQDFSSPHRILRANARTAARAIARSGLEHRVSSNPMIKETAHPIPEVLDDLKRDTVYKSQLVTWQILGGLENFRRVQATLIDRLAYTIGQHSIKNM